MTARRELSGAVAIHGCQPVSTGRKAPFPPTIAAQAIEGSDR